MLISFYMYILSYPLFRGSYINRWLVAGPWEEQVVREEGGARNIQPGLQGKFPPDIKAEILEPGAPVSWQNKNQSMRVYYPFDDTRVNLSDFWFLPTHISAYAAALLFSKKEQTAAFEAVSCNGMAIWLNGILVKRLEPLARNQPQSEKFKLLLHKGKNRLEVCWDALAERNTSFYFSLACLDGDGIEQGIPIGRRDPDRLNKAEQAMKELSFLRNHFTSGEVVVHGKNPYEDETFLIQFTEVTEKNKTTLPFSRTLRLNPGKCHASLGKIEEFPFGFLRFLAETEVEGICIGRIITIESHPLAFLPPAANTAAERKKQALAFIAKHGKENLSRAIALLYTNGNAGEIEGLLYKQLSYINNRSDCSNFYLILLPHLVRITKDDRRLPAELQAAIKNCILNFHYWLDEPGNENHPLLFYSCQFLCGELYPDEIFINSGLTGREIQQKARERLDRWFETFFAEGFPVWNSITWLSQATLGFACLYGGAKNSGIREKARRGLDFIFYSLAVYGLDGYFASTSGCVYDKDLLGNFANSTSFLSYIGYGTGNMSHGDYWVLPLCLSDYEPPPDYAVLQRPAPGETLICQSSFQGLEESVNLYCYKTHGFTLASANNFRPGKRGYLEHPIQCTFSPTSQFWINHPKEAAPYGTGPSSPWAGNGILPQVNQYKAFASVIFDISEDHPIGFTHLYFPTMEFQTCRYQDNWLFGQFGGDGNYYCAVYAAKGLESEKTGPNMDREFISEGRRNIWIIRSTCREEFGSFDEFMEICKALDFHIDLDTLSFRLRDLVYGELTGGWSKPLALNGGAVRYSGFPREGLVSKELIRSIA